ncbi:MAG: phenylalanine--tRNA ligase subunit beta, partial [bacterium]
MLEIEVTPNRGDALSAQGVARQLAALLGLACKAPFEEGPSRLRAPDTPGLGDSSRRLTGDPEGAPPSVAAWTVATEDAEGCGLYTARLLEGVRVGPSPEWMQKRLAACGMRPINNVVDVTNYVMLELGQPLHAFDTARLRGRRIVARRARAGEKITTLDGTLRALPADAVVIADEGGPVAVAGVMGGVGSEIGTGTTTVLLESAWFDPIRVRRGARGLGLSTESSYRFERGVDPGGVARASARAAQLLGEFAGAKPVSALLEARGRLPAPVTIAVNARAVSSLLGVTLAAGEIGDLCRRIGCTATVEGEVVRVTPPTWRLDLSLPADIAEECAILHGYDRIPTTVPVGRAAAPVRAKAVIVEARVREALRAAGCTEARTLSFVRRADLARLDPAGAGAAVKLLNPMSEDEEFLRTTLLPGLARAAGYNLAREAAGVALFETGAVFTGGDAGPRETPRL